MAVTEHCSSGLFLIGYYCYEKFQNCLFLQFCKEKKIKLWPSLLTFSIYCIKDKNLADLTSFRLSILLYVNSVILYVNF